MTDRDASDHAEGTHGTDHAADAGTARRDGDEHRRTGSSEGDDGADERRFDATNRRALLGASAAGLLSMTAGCSGLLGGGETPSGTEPTGSPSGGDLADSGYASHDHSGTFGAPAMLGEESPVESITADTIDAGRVDVGELVTESSPLVNVAAYGVEGDGETDDAPALQEAMDAAIPNGTLYIPHDYEVRLGGTVTAEFWELGQPKDTLDRFKFVCEGVLTPDPGIGNAIELVDAVGPYVFVNVQRGGENVETDTLVHVTGGRDGLFEGFGYAYDGRIFHFEDTGTYSIGHLKTFQCGQSLAVFDASPMGEIRDMFEISMARGPEFHDSTDVCINQYENFQEEATTTQGVLFEDCLSVFIDRLLVGGSANTPPVEFRDCDNMFVNAMHLGGFPELGGVFEDVRNSTFRIVCNVGSRGIRYTGDNSDANRFVVNATNIDETGVIVDESVSGGYHYFAGSVTNEGALGFDVRTADAEIHLDNVYAVGNDDGDLAVVEGNDVHLSNCRIDDIDGTPKTINGVGMASAAADAPDPGEWPVGTNVIFEDADDGSGDGLYLITGEDQWVRFGDVTYGG